MQLSSQPTCKIRIQVLQVDSVCSFTKSQYVEGRVKGVENRCNVMDYINERDNITAMDMSANQSFRAVINKDSKYVLKYKKILG
jgi:hypothetical protein